jgi:hypothetical protein
VARRSPTIGRFLKNGYLEVALQMLDHLSKLHLNRAKLIQELGAATLPLLLI